MTQARLRIRRPPRSSGPTRTGCTSRLTPSSRPPKSEVAAHRAARIGLAPGSGSVLDLGCGIGGDLVAFARTGLTIAGVDPDPLRVAVAAANLAALDLPGAVRVADATTLDLSPFGSSSPTRPGARHAAALRPGPLDAPLAVRGRAARGRRRPASRSRPASRTSGCQTTWRPSGRASRRGEGGVPLVPRAGHVSPARHRIGTGGLATLTDEDDPEGANG